MKDIPPEVNDMLFHAMMLRTPAERLLMGMDMAATARALVWASIPADLPEGDRRRMFYERFYGEPWVGGADGKRSDGNDRPARTRRAPAEDPFRAAPPDPPLSSAPFRAKFPA